MDAKTKGDISYRIGKAKKDLGSSKILFENEYFSQSLNRSYYAIFHAARALLALDNFESKKHSGVIAYFITNFVLTKKIDKRYGTILKLAERTRIKSDYNRLFFRKQRASSNSATKC